MARVERRTIKRKPAGRRSEDWRTFRLSSLLPQAAYRVGLGNDVHRLVAGRKLVLGGVRVPFEKGPLGHSDGDALAHAICDALLGAAALGDIGRYFPDDSPQWHNAASRVFLRRVRQLLDDAGYEIVSIDSTIGLERPKLAPHLVTMRRQLARALGITPEQVSVKAKSGEGLDAVGRGEAIRADAVALIVRRTEAKMADP
jgi:2-C-methyl-D-erythritol 2,4-cyclodiphosphate synthase